LSELKATLSGEHTALPCQQANANSKTRHMIPPIKRSFILRRLRRA
jgi:hypothetical protein